MVAGKVKMAMGLQRSPANSKPNSSPKPPFSTPQSSASASNKQQSQKGAAFSRSFGVYFPRASAQVQPRPPDVTELLCIVEDLRERESRLKTQLLEQKLLKESVAVVPFLENQIGVKESEIERLKAKIECLEDENERLRQDVEMLHLQLSKQNSIHDEKLRNLQVQISDLNKLNQELVLTSQRGVDACVCDKATVTKTMRKYTKDENEVKKEVVNIVVAEKSALSSRIHAPRVAKPPPMRPSSSLLSGLSSSSSSSSSLLSSSSSFSFSSPSYSSMAESAERAMEEIPNILPAPPLSKVVPPPPPPPPAKGLKGVPAKVRKVPEVVEFYHSLMRRYSRRESSGGGAGGVADAPAPATAAKDMIGEIENRSAHLLAIKTDVETQGDFIRFLIKEVENAAFKDIEDVVPFVKWLDDELSFLVDERAVLKHFDWPEQKADALREAAFGYGDLKKLESEASSFRDEPRQRCASALKKMQSLLEKLEHGVYNLSRMRESAAKRYKVFNIPIDWMQDTGFVSQMKLASVKLAMKYMKRVSAELETLVRGPEEEEELIVQGVRFAFRVHQFAGGFDVETMRAFQELRDKARSCHIQCRNQQHQNVICRSTAC